MKEAQLAAISDRMMAPLDGDSSGSAVMVAVNMAKWPDDFVVHKMYCCPATENGWADGYRHYPARYIANYVSKGAKYVGVVKACVHLRKIGADRVLWKFDDISDAEAIAEAEIVRAATRRNQRPCIVFLQSQLSVTDFVYDLRGGLQSSRIYFDLSDLEPIDVKDLACKLRSSSWSSLAKRRS